MFLETFSKNDTKYFDAFDGTFGTLLMDLLKAYECANYEFIIAKLEANGVVENSQKRLIQNYFSQRKHRVKVNDLLFFIKETDTTIFACRKDLDEISNKLGLETNSAINGLKIMKW